MTTAPGAGPGPRVPAVPGPGPAWFGAVMGTGGLCALLQIHSPRLSVFGLLAVTTLLLSWVLLVGLGACAVLSTIRGFLARMAFNPGLWAMAYPLGTCALGAHYLGWEAASLVTVFALCGVWLLCAVASTRAILRARLA